MARGGVTSLSLRPSPREFGQQKSRPDTPGRLSSPLWTPLHDRGPKRGRALVQIYLPRLVARGRYRVRRRVLEVWPVLEADELASRVQPQRLASLDHPLPYRVLQVPVRLRWVLIHRHDVDRYPIIVPGLASLGVRNDRPRCRPALRIQSILLGPRAKPLRHPERYPGGGQHYVHLGYGRSQRWVHQL